MAKKVTGMIKLQIPGGQANPAPPVGPALGQQGVNIMAFCKEFNAATKSQAGMVIPVVITVYQDKSFTFITKSPPAAILLKKAAGIAAGAKMPNKDKVGKVTRPRYGRSLLRPQCGRRARRAEDAMDRECHRHVRRDHGRSIPGGRATGQRQRGSRHSHR